MTVGLLYSGESSLRTITRLGKLDTVLVIHLLILSLGFQTNGQASLLGGAKDQAIASITIYDRCFGVSDHVHSRSRVARSPMTSNIPSESVLDYILSFLS